MIFHIFNRCIELGLKSGNLLLSNFIQIGFFGNKKHCMQSPLTRIKMKYARNLVSAGKTNAESQQVEGSLQLWHFQQNMQLGEPPVCTVICFHLS